MLLDVQYKFSNFQYFPPVHQTIDLLILPTTRSKLFTCPSYLLIFIFNSRSDSCADSQIGSWHQGISPNRPEIIFILVDRRRFMFSRPSGQRQTTAKEYKRPFFKLRFISTPDSILPLRFKQNECEPHHRRAFEFAPPLLPPAPRSHREYHPSPLSFLGRGVFLVLWTWFSLRDMLVMSI